MLLIGLGLQVASAGGAVPTYNHDVRAILDSRCVSCHQPHGTAERIPLTSYSEAHDLADKIRETVSRRLMPPWPIDSSHSLPMRNDPRLTEAQIEAVIRWADSGAPEGAPAIDRRVPLSAGGWNQPQGRAPDIVFSFPKFQIPATGELPYLQVLIPVGVPEDRWIVGMQAIPGNPSVVHHMGIVEERLRDDVRPADVPRLEQVARSMGLPSQTLLSPSPAVVDPDDPDTFDILATYTPGTTYEAYEPDTAKLLKGGDAYYINFNVHYTTTGQPETDGSMLGLWLRKDPPRRQLYRFPSPGKTILANGRQLLSDDPGTRAEGAEVAIPPIPPFAPDYELVGITGFLRPVTLYQLQPHAHLRARSFTYRVAYPDGREQTLLTVPDFDYHWQMSYEFAKPVRLPAGSKLIVTAHYDNSDANAHLREAAATDPQRRCGPDKQVLFRDQNQTWDEMFSPIIQFASDRRSSVHDLRIVAVTGCLVHDRAGAVRLESASMPASAQSQSTSRAEILTAGSSGLGRGSFLLLGEQPFEAEARRGAKVFLKGVLIPNGTTPRINVTSLQSIGDRCE